ncbi:tetratricopeptide repeat protein [Prochlorococcus marinus]|uniref:tetratricopeptide repeat protein n=1 Tax=Prochlorococcus marinus TaxID=1219 RepID=UPI0009E28DDD|nr:tetratricopeptide repeat protein [Prochlorococcus marinus]
MNNFITTKMLDEASLKIGIKDYAGAKNIYTKLINSNLARNLLHENELPLFNRGLVNLKLKNYESAIKDFTQVIKINNKNDESYFYRAIAKENSGNHDSALIDFDTSIKLNPLEKLYKNEKKRITKIINQKSDNSRKGNQEKIKKNILNSRIPFKKTKFISKSFLNNFKDSEKEVVNLLFGVDNEEIFTIIEISQILKINLGLVENIRSKALLIMDKEISNIKFKSKNKITSTNKQKLNPLTKNIITKPTKSHQNKEDKEEIKNSNLLGKVEKEPKINIAKLITILFLLIVIPITFINKIFINKPKLDILNISRDMNEKEFNQIIKNNIIKNEDLTKKEQLEFFKYGKSALISKQFKASQKFFTLLIENDPNNPLAFHFRGVSKFNLRDYSGAINDFSKAIKLDEKSITSYNNRGIAKASLKNYQGAINDFSKAIKLDKNYANGYLSRGTANYKLGNYKESLIDFDKAVKLSPNEGEIYIGRSIVKEKNNNIKGACMDMKKAINLSIIDQSEKSWFRYNCKN